MSIEKGTLNNITTKDKGKVAITVIQYSAPDRAMLFSFYNHPNHSKYRLTGQVLSPRKLSLHVNASKRISARIKG